MIMSQPVKAPIQPWSKVKIAILRDYAEQYTRIMGTRRFETHYIEAFAGSGTHLEKRTGEDVLGTPREILAIEPGFAHYHFIELDPNRANELRKLKAVGSGQIHVYEADANETLLTTILPQIQFSKYRRALVFVDPYTIDLDWRVTSLAGSLKTVDMFINFMIVAANRNALLQNPDEITDVQRARMNRVWGDESWFGALYDKRQMGLFDSVSVAEKVPQANRRLGEAYQRRLSEVAGFGYAAPPRLFKNRAGAELYYLFFASPKASGYRIAKHLLEKPVID
jgi:three-Cys-motif partner protein